MEQRRRRKHGAHKRVLVVCRDHRSFLEATPGGRTTLARLERAVAVVVDRSRRQARCRIEQRAASNRSRKARRTLYRGLAHVAKVSRIVARIDTSATELERTSWTTDDDLVARAEAVLAAASAHEALFARSGIQPGLLDSLAGALAALKHGKDAVIRARARFTAATVAIDRALADADKAILIVRGILATSPDAPVGVLTAVRQAKRIGPRVKRRRRAREDAGQGSRTSVRQAERRRPVTPNQRPSH